MHQKHLTSLKQAYRNEAIVLASTFGWSWNCGGWAPFWVAKHTMNWLKCVESKSSLQVWSSFDSKNDWICVLNLNNILMPDLDTRKIWAEIVSRKWDCWFLILTSCLWMSIWAKRTFLWYPSPLSATWSQSIWLLPVFKNQKATPRLLFLKQWRTPKRLCQLKTLTVEDFQGWYSKPFYFSWTSSILTSHVYREDVMYLPVVYRGCDVIFVLTTVCW